MGKTVAVIGVGLAGLTALRHLTDSPGVSEIVAFERYGEVGGVWVYTDRVGTDVDGLPVHSAANKDLRTNSPKIGMYFHDFPIPNASPPFWPHDEFKDYLQAYAKHCNMPRNIKFNTVVTKVEPLSRGKRDTRWKVTYCSGGKPGTSTAQDFDVVIVCNGHFFVPYEPDIVGKETFKGEIIHAHDFRTKDHFKDKSVLLVGVGPTTFDLLPILGPITKKIIVSEKPYVVDYQIPVNTCRKPLIHHLLENSVIFDNGDEERVDAIIIATGYRYSFPFLTEDCRIVLRDEDRRVTPLYKHMIHTIHPSLMFVGLVDYGFNAVYFDRQVRFIAKVLDGSVSLPDQSAMELDTDREFETRITRGGVKSQNFHKLVLFGGEYCDSLAELADIPTMPMCERKLFEHIITDSMVNETLTYKEHEYKMSGDSFVKLY